MKVRNLFLVALLGAGLAPVAWPTTLMQLSLEQLSQAASAIVRGRVVSQVSQWNSTRTQIVTLTTIAVDQALKGHPSATVVVEQPGGTMGDIHVRVAGAVRFHPGQSYMLFLEPASTDPSRHLLVGMVQGAYRMYRDEQTGEERVIHPLGGLFYGPRDPARGAKPPAPTLSLREFHQQLSAAVQAPVVIPRGTSIPLSIQSTEAQGVQRVWVLGRTTATIYPSATAVIPVGSLVEGTGQLVAGRWKIRWTEVSVRGTRVEIHASSDQPAGGPLRGRMLVVNVR